MDKCRTRSSSKFLCLLSVISLTILIVACDSDNKTNAVDLTDRVSIDILTESNNENTSNTNSKDVLIFGFDLRNSPSEDAKQYLPFINYLNKETNLQFELKFTPKGSDIATELGEGRIHLAAIGATSYILANERYGVTVLTRGVNNKGKAEYRSIIVTHPSSNLKILKDLKDNRFAFGSIDSTQGHLIPRIELAKQEITLKDLGSYQYTGSHLNCANAVISAQVDACGMQDTLAEEFASKRLLHVLYASPYYPSSGIAANQDITKEVLEKITKALIAFEPEGKHKELLYHWDKTEMPKGFVLANSNDYTELRKWMIRFNLLTEAKRSN